MVFSGFRASPQTCQGLLGSPSSHSHPQVLLPGELLPSITAVLGLGVPGHLSLERTPQNRVSARPCGSQALVCSPAPENAFPAEWPWPSGQVRRDLSLRMTWSLSAATGTSGQTLSVSQPGAGPGVPFLGPEGRIPHRLQTVPQAPRVTPLTREVPLLTQLMFPPLHACSSEHTRVPECLCCGHTASWAGHTCCRCMHRPPHPWLEGPSFQWHRSPQRTPGPHRTRSTCFLHFHAGSLLPFPLWMARMRTSLLLLPRRVRALIWACRALWVTPLSLRRMFLPCALRLTEETPGVPALSSVQGLLRTRASPQPLSPQWPGGVLATGGWEHGALLSISLKVALAPHTQSHLQP
ncbi:uncharacterized protein [Symphalangus syndactylus]|uniref:uncharacterized protein n=1 Tax=Symphalangus syndactylus TaxID=9590 RepID=UPI0024426D78|nr:uncharacterized protein LOC129464584 [Symphalangus syndactylus]